MCHLVYNSVEFVGRDTNGDGFSSLVKHLAAQLSTSSIQQHTSVQHSQCTVSKAMFYANNALLSRSYQLCTTITQLTDLISNHIVQLTPQPTQSKPIDLHSQSLDWYWLTKQYRKIHKLNTTQKTNNTKYSKTKLAWFNHLLPSLGQETRWAYSTTLPGVPTPMQFSSWS